MSSGPDRVPFDARNARRQRPLMVLTGVLLVWAAATPAPAQTFIRGDANADGTVDSLDTLTILNAIFLEDPIPDPIDRADANDNEFITLSDALLIAAHIFCPPPNTIPPPFPNAGLDPDDSTRGFGSVQEGYRVNFELGAVDPGEVAIRLTVDTPEPLLRVDFTVLLDAALTPQVPAFVTAANVGRVEAETVRDGNLLFVSVRAADCEPSPIPAGSGVEVGTLRFDQNGNIAACAIESPLTWVPDTVVAGVMRRAALVTTSYADHHPSANFTAGNFIRGDANHDGFVSAADSVTILEFVLFGDPLPAPLDRADVNDNEFVTIADALALQGALFCAGAPPIPPPNSCGPDPTDSTRGFGTVQPSYSVNLTLGTIRSQTVEFHVTVGTPAPLSEVNFTLELDPALTPLGPVFTPAPGLISPVVEEDTDGNLWTVSVRNAECENLMMHAGDHQALGTLAFGQDGSISPCPSVFPASWVADTALNGVPRRASLVTTAYVELHPDFTMTPCGSDFIRGDLNNSGEVDTVDVVYFLEYLILDGTPPRDCSGEPLLETADLNDNEWVTVGDMALLTNHLFCGPTPEIPLPDTCGPDPHDSQAGFHMMDGDYESTASVEVTLAKAEVLLELRIPPGREATATTLILRFDPDILTPQEQPVFCPIPGVSEVGHFRAGNSIVASAVSGDCDAFSVNAATGLIPVGTVHFFHNGVTDCSEIVSALSLVSEITTADGFTYRATIVDGTFRDHHPTPAPFRCGEFLADFVRGDSDGDGVFNGLLDALHVLAFIFQGGPAPPCLDAADADDDGVINGIFDGLHILAHQFQGGPPPPPPYPGCGPDPTGDDRCDELGCRALACP